MAFRDSVARPTRPLIMKERENRPVRACFPSAVELPKTVKEKLFPRFNKSKRDFLKNAIQGFAATIGMGLLVRNEQINQAQAEQIKGLDEWDRLAGAFAIESYVEAKANDEAILIAINVLCQELGIKGFMIRDGKLYRAKEK